jgi:hypothetical protein
MLGYKIINQRTEEFTKANPENDHTGMEDFL